MPTSSDTSSPTQDRGQQRSLSASKPIVGAVAVVADPVVTTFDPALTTVRERAKARHLPWSDLDWALFLLDGAEQSIVDEFHAPASRDALALLTKYHERVEKLRRMYVVATR